MIGNGKMTVREEWERGELVVLGEYRMSKAELIQWRDKQTGKAMEAPMLRHTVEFGSISVQVAERVPDGTRVEDIHVGFSKGDKVAVYLTELTSTRGAVSAGGRLLKLPQVQGESAPVGGSAGVRK